MGEKEEDLPSVLQAQQPEIIESEVVDVPVEVEEPVDVEEDTPEQPAEVAVETEQTTVEEDVQTNDSTPELPEFGL